MVKAVEYEYKYCLILENMVLCENKSGLLGKTCSYSMRKTKAQISCVLGTADQRLCGCGNRGWFKSYLVENLEDRVSRRGLFGFGR